MKLITRQSLVVIGIALTAILLALCISAQAEQPKKISRIGYLAGITAAAQSARIEAFREGLRELGYSEGKNIIIESRYAEGNADRVRSLAMELVRLKVDVILSAGSSDTLAAKEATATIPIVMAAAGDPVASGFVTSLARPGGNITGLSILAPELSGKQRELLREIIPKLSRVAVFETSTTPGAAQALKEMKLAAQAFGVKLEYLDILAFKDIETAFRAASKAHADAIVALGGPLFNSHRTHIIELATKSRIPVMYNVSEFVDSGGLITYGASWPDLFRRAATYVDKILKGAKPADLPIEQPKKFDLIINLNAAKQIGLTIPPNVLARADKVVK